MRSRWRTTCFARTSGDQCVTMSFRAFAPSAAQSDGSFRARSKISAKCSASGSAHMWSAKGPSPTSTGPDQRSGKPFVSSRYAVGPDHAVAATAAPDAMASTWGRPQPSPRVGSATRSARRYSAARSSPESPDRNFTVPSAPRPSGSPSCSFTKTSACLSKSSSPWYAFVRSTSAAEPRGSLAACQAFSSTSQPLRFSHLNTDATTNTSSATPSIA
mmetsp:Transcript_20384/g.62801  ORF Transcript_20384/g.62801 Transcript_20384/m.62801 type:complete len:216 (-) Transcript_20384:751-1398(-)